MDSEIRKGKSPFLVKTAPAQIDLGRLLNDEIIPRLHPDDIFTHESHQWQKAGDKWRGGCPWHDSKSGTSFYINVGALSWRCSACDVGGGPVQYLHKLARGVNADSPKGQDFIDILKDLAQRAKVPYPEVKLSPEQQRRAEAQESRRAILGDVYELCVEVLRSEAGAAARAYMDSRGFGEDGCEKLQLGLYPSCAEVRKRLRGKHTAAAIKESGAVFEKMVGYVTFPWRDDRGQPLGLYGTWPAKLSEDDKRPKKMSLYNPKDENQGDLEHIKRSPLYLDRALQVGKTDLVLVEGITDAGLPQALGDASVIACVAAQLSHEQTDTLRRRGIKSITICLDPDKGGENGVRSCARQLFAANIRPYVAPRLPEGMDPDDFILAHGLDGWRDHLKGKVHAFRHEAESIIAGQPREPGDDGWSDRIIDTAVKYAAAQPAVRDDELQRHFWGAISEATGCSASDLRPRVAQARQTQSNGQLTADDAPGLVTTCAADIKPRPLRWLVPGVLPLGKLTLIAGDGGLGKSRLTLDLTANLSHGRPAFGLTYPAISGDTLIASCEDDWSDTIVPRLLASGADLSRIHLLEGVESTGKRPVFWSLAHHLQLDKYLRDHPDVRLVIIDPAGAFAGRAGIDGHKDAELRALLGPLAELAAARNVTELLVGHVGKTAHPKAVQRVLGSVGWVNSVRAAWVVVEKDDGTKLLLPLKGNLSPRRKGLAYRFGPLSSSEKDLALAGYHDLPAEDLEEIKKDLYRPVWLGEVDVDADSVFAEAAKRRRGDKTRIEEAAEWLKLFLKNHAYPSEEIVQAGKAKGFSFDNVKEAKLKLKEAGLKSSNKSRFGGNWWSGFGDPDKWVLRPDQQPPFSPLSPFSPFSPQTPHNGGKKGERGEKGVWAVPEWLPSTNRRRHFDPSRRTRRDFHTTSEGGNSPSKLPGEEVETLAQPEKRP